MKVGQTSPSIDKVVRPALGAETAGVGEALRVTQLALRVWVDEVESIAVTALAKLVKLGTVLISVLAPAIPVLLVSLDAFQALGAEFVVLEAVVILQLA